MKKKKSRSFLLYFKNLLNFNKVDAIANSNNENVSYKKIL